MRSDGDSGGGGLVLHRSLHCTKDADVVSEIQLLIGKKNVTIVFVERVELEQSGYWLPGHLRYDRRT